MKKCFVSNKRRGCLLKLNIGENMGKMVNSRGYANLRKQFTFQKWLIVLKESGKIL